MDVSTFVDDNDIVLLRNRVKWQQPSEVKQATSSSSNLRSIHEFSSMSENEIEAVLNGDYDDLSAKEVKMSKKNKDQFKFSKKRCLQEIERTQS
jgi:hypothetical protein